MTPDEITDHLLPHLPGATDVPPGTPRYPNLWLFVEASSSDQANERTWDVLERATGMVDDLPEDHGPEGSDVWGRHRRLEPVELAGGTLDHDHQLHLRIYLDGLGDGREISVAGRTLWQAAASVHYEVDEPHHLHPYVDECPLCGCVGTFEGWRDADRHSKNVWVHDPLGLELVMSGTADGRPIPAVSGILPAGLSSGHLTLGESELSAWGIEAPRLDVVVISGA